MNLTGLRETFPSQCAEHPLGIPDKTKSLISFGENSVMLEIERKFLIQKLPDLSQIKPIRYERYFISDEDKNQIRVQKKGHKYELETKQQINEQEYYKTKREITKTEFLELSAECNKSIIRLSYLISESPNITIKK